MGNGEKCKSKSGAKAMIISLDKGCIEKLKPYVEKHGGNFSAAVREIIDKAKKPSQQTHEN